MAAPAPAFQPIDRNMVSHRSSSSLDEEKKAQIIEHREGVVTETNPFGLSQDDHDFLANFPEERRKKIIRKLDIRLLPLLAFLYLVAYIDRANIGNAKIEGMDTDLNLTGPQYNIAVSIFFIPYVIFEVPSNTLLIRFKKPSHYIGMITVAWGIVMTLTGLVNNYGGLIATRFMLGVCEAGFFPGAVYTVSRWYLPNETQLRISLFYVSSALSGAISGLLAFAIAKMDGISGVAGWRWIFIIEGIASVVAGVGTFFLLVDTPSLSGSWLKEDEIRYLNLRLIAQHGNTQATKEAEKSKKWQILRTVLTDWKLYTMAIVFWGNSAPNYGLKFTMPQIIKNMGYTSATAQLMTMPPYIVGALSSLTTGFFADKLTWRCPFICAGLTVVVIAYAILYTKSVDISNNIGVCYFALCLACAGLYPITPGTNAWTLNNLGGPTKRAQGSAFMICMGNIGGIIGSYMFFDSEAPEYPTGWGLSFGLASAGIAMALFIEFVLWTKNKKRAKMSEAEIREKYSEEELALMGDKSPLFKYTL